MLDLLLILGGIVGLIVLYRYWSSPAAVSTDTQEEPKPTTKSVQKKTNIQSAPSRKQVEKKKAVRHSLCIQEIKDSKYATESIAIDPMQTYIASVSEENSIQLHSLVDKRIIKYKLPTDHPNKICLSGDGNYIVVALNDSKELHAYRITTKVRLRQ